MSLKNNYEYTKDYCGYHLIKSSMFELRDGIVGAEGTPDTSMVNLQGYSGPTYEGPINGHFYHNVYIRYCLFCICPCSRDTYQVEGYKRRLGEVKVLADCCVCTPQHQVVDGQDRSIGYMKRNCIQPCSVFTTQLQITTYHPAQTYVLERICCTCTPGVTWEGKDGSGRLAARMNFTRGFCGWNPTIRLNFFGNMSNNDKILFLTSIPWLP